jgi:hypothetical protein
MTGGGLTANGVRTTTVGLGTMERATGEKGEGKGRMHPTCALHPEGRGRRILAWSCSIDSPTRNLGGWCLSQTLISQFYIARIRPRTICAAVTMAKSPH